MDVLDAELALQPGPRPVVDQRVEAAGLQHDVHGPHVGRIDPLLLCADLSVASAVRWVL